MSFFYPRYISVLYFTLLTSSLSASNYLFPCEERKKLILYTENRNAIVKEMFVLFVVVLYSIHFRLFFKSSLVAIHFHFFAFFQFCLFPLFGGTELQFGYLYVFFSGAQINLFDPEKMFEGK